ncbi:MAG TPA: Asp-tRNA(Asn)/Glu-tRNA(Gln) amidotransferase subunit GatA [Prosthecobacter sp.]|nr:Asp-tRNA(Asn)/Glu-tRNA(Gln) amidotransferase subunit GatA [Prosthecobacter sp.]
MSDELFRLTIHQAATLLRQREISAVELTQAVLERIVAVDNAVKAYLSLMPEAALESAAEADRRLAAADDPASLPPLVGIPLAIKDVILVEGAPTTCGSKMLEDFVAPYEATVIGKLRRAGAVLLGKTNTDEFAMGSSTENSAFVTTRNPWDLSRVPGGSSGGSAAAVAGDLAIAALGSDTGGSIRQPAALCGCVGLKPTYGRVSRYGLVAFASSLDQIGPLTRTVEDAALLLNHLCGKDARDSTSLDAEAPDFTAALGRDIKGLRIGLPKEYFIEGIHAGVSASVKAAVERLAALGAELVEVSLPHTDLGVATYYILAPAEASANLARFDGVRYGHRSSEAGDLMEHYFKSRAEGFGPEVKRRILLGTYVLSSGYYDAYYLKAQRARTLIRRDFEQAFEKVDVLVSPTSPAPAHKIGELKDNPLAAYLEDVFTIPVNLAGLPGISVPCAPVEVEGVSLPVGLQIIGKPLDELSVLRVADAFERG